ncbi:MAG TPA: ABC transporter ATP-binding protein [Bdellovibrionota bacterium]|nr:ABC transporter ATP-binding protein [Bdellovibrionota bacterium]
MKRLAIEAFGLSKKYRVGSKRYHDSTLREALVSVARRLRSLSSPKSEDLWALRDATFEVEEGEALAIVGRNRAGKSTLLKVLGRITFPTEGRALIRGRVGSLLEVGMGFHPDLTGRDNIFLNGAILGMKREEIRRKFDDIVDFAGIERFLDTPVKHYSSGMYMRLAFAVAAHLETEILLIDEVLAVGDAQFQKKCLQRMKDVTGAGRTILFVSHNMAAVKRLCQRAILLSDGRMIDQGPTAEIVERYLAGQTTQTTSVTYPDDALKTMRIRGVELLGPTGELAEKIYGSRGFRVRIAYDVNEPVHSAFVLCRVHVEDGVTLFSTTDTDLDPGRLETRKTGSYVTEFTVPPKLLAEGQYFVSVSVGIPYQFNFDHRLEALSFMLEDDGSETREWLYRSRPGYLALDFEWRTTHCDFVGSKR